MSNKPNRKVILISLVMAASAGFQVYGASDGVSAPAALDNNASGIQTVGSSRNTLTPLNAGVQINTSGGKAVPVGADESAVLAAGNTSVSTDTGSSNEDKAILYLSPNDEDQIRAQSGKTVTEIDFSGVPEEVKAQLLPLLNTKVGDTVSLDGIRTDVGAIGGTGVFSQVSPAFSAVPEGVKITYRLVSNPVVRQVEFTGNTVFKSDYLRSLMNISPNSVLNTVLVNQKIQEIENLYMKQGYILVSVPDVKMGDDGTLHIAIAEGTIENITVVGNKKTKDYVITREMKVKKGQPFNKFLASRSMERIYNLGYFEDVNMRLLPGQKDHDVIIEVDVVEQKTGVVTVGAGYSESDGLVGLLEFGENNLRGTGDKINFHWEFGGSSHGKNYQISYTRPWIDSNGDSLGVSFFDRRYSYDDYNAKGHTIASYDKRRKGYNLTLGRVTGEYQTNYLTWESVRESYDDYDGFSAGSPMTDQPGDWTDPSATVTKNGVTVTNVQRQWYDAIMNNFGRTNSTTFTHVFDSRDNYFNATKGHRLSLSGQVAGHGLGGDYDFYKLTAEGRFYKKLGNGHVLALRLMGGYMSGDAPYTQLFSLGGADTLRGYEDDQFKGRNMYEATLEYRFPIVKKVEGVVFTDMGNAWNVDKSRIPWYMDDNSIHASVGVEIRLQTPIGPIRLDFGHGDENKFHFSFGTQF